MLTGALQGRRVLELADESGVYCGKLFADMGADVVKIERPGGDATRAIPPFLRGEPGADRSLFFLYMNTSKRGVTLALERPEGREIFLRLAAGADLVVETFRPGFLDALGLGYEALRAQSPRLVLTSITGFGQTGPHRDFRSCDLVASALGGVMHVTGHGDDPPVRLAGRQMHVAASTTAAAASLVALLHASASGRGQHVDVSLDEVAVSVSHICGVGKWLDDGIVPRRAGTSLFASVPSGTYACRDGLVYLMVNRPAHWKALARWIHEVSGIEEVLDPMFEGPSANRIPYRELLDLWIGDFAARFRVQEIYREGQARHLAFTPVNSATALAADEQLAAREHFVEIEHPRAGRLRYPGAPYRHAGTPWRAARPAPGAGEHNDEIYGGELGVPAQTLRAWRERGVI